MISIEDIDHGYKKIVEEIKSFEKSFVKVGVLSNAGKEKDGTDLVDVATFNEYGTSRIPSRPFMAQTFDKNQNDIHNNLENGLGAIIDGKRTSEMVLKEIGVWYQGQIRKMFRDGDYTPNAPSTIRIKTKGAGGDTTPLIDTGRLIQSINYTVEKE